MLNYQRVIQKSRMNRLPKEVDYTKIEDLTKSAYVGAESATIAFWRQCRNTHKISWQNLPVFQAKSKTRGGSSGFIMAWWQSEIHGFDRNSIYISHLALTEAMKEGPRLIVHAGVFIVGILRLPPVFIHDTLVLQAELVFKMKEIGCYNSETVCKNKWQIHFVIGKTMFKSTFVAWKSRNLS